MITPALLVLVLAAICFLLAALEIQPNRAMALGLFFITLFLMFKG